MEKKIGSRLLASRIELAMKTKKLDIIGLSDKADSTYEHVRKIVRGFTFPSKFFLRILCDILDLDFMEMDRLLQIDKLVHRYGFIPAELVEQVRKVS